MESVSTQYVVKYVNSDAMGTCLWLRQTTLSMPMALSLLSVACAMDDYTNMPQQSFQFNHPQERYYSPFKTAMVVLLILGMIANNPGCTNKILRCFLKTYGNEYAFTESILQEARTAAKNSYLVHQK